MRKLAVNHWTKQAPEGRVEWCYNAATDFFRGGGLKKLMEKQIRRRQFNEDVNECCCCFVTRDTETCSNTIYPTVHEKLLLLDVGSCFNPFAAYEDVYPVAIDLQPAERVVFECDFLNLEFQDLPHLQDVCPCSSLSKSKTKNPEWQSASKEHLKLDNMCKMNLEERTLTQHESTATSLQLETNSKNLHSTSPLLEDQTKILYLESFLTEGKQVKILPSEQFNVVVFSLLLSYFPSAVQRWECCRKAYKLLRPNGMLLIITPDSSHQNKNAAMMKSWKTGIESLGFVRWEYEKQTHLHCMAFRKVAPCHSCNRGNGDAEMMYIPQDFQEEEDGDCLVDWRSEEDDSVIMECFGELPDL